MKTCALFLFLLSSGCVMLAQESEFKLYPNGFIYSERAMTRLAHTVDSLNLHFNTCDMNRSFYAYQQTLGTVVKYSGKDVKQAVKDMENRITTGEFVEKYPGSEVVYDALILRTFPQDKTTRGLVKFEYFNIAGNYDLSIKSSDISLYNADVQGRWVVDYSPATEYSKESVLAFYFNRNFQSAKLPHRYAMMIAYSDCMIDTGESKMKNPKRSGYIPLPRHWEDLSEREKADLLEKKRSTSVWGFCSMDQSPRLHAIDIAVLSAETYNWPVFLRSHLDVMNDRFDRASDGNYAWGGRKTYIRELEELNIQVHDLLLGITFRVSNPAANHYYGSIGRLGRSLAETKDVDAIEEKILSVVSDTDLDLYNRLIFYYLFLNYNQYVSDNIRKETNRIKLETAVKTLPVSIQVQIRKGDG